MKNKGCLVISLDFELMWGGVGVWDESGYVKSNVAGAKSALLKIVKICNNYGVHLTIASVGMLMLKDKDEFVQMKPYHVPTYGQMELSPYKEGYVQNINNASLYFVPEIFKQLEGLNGIEIGSHTYSHFFCWEKGQTIEQFSEDLRQNIKVASRFNCILSSLVFPRNQVSPEYLKIAKANGFTAYRGNAKSFFNEPKSALSMYVMKLLRFFDSYFCLSGHNSYKYEEVENINGLWNIRASCFFRPYNDRLRFLEKLKLNRICKEIEYAAKRGEIYHLWWHPHNFGANMKENLSELETVLKCFRECSKKYGMKSYTMSELVEIMNRHEIR